MPAFFQEYSTVNVAAKLRRSTFSGNTIRKKTATRYWYPADIRAASRKRCRQLRSRCCQAQADQGSNSQDIQLSWQHCRVQWDLTCVKVCHGRVVAKVPHVANSGCINPQQTHCRCRRHGAPSVHHSASPVFLLLSTRRGQGASALLLQKTCASLVWQRATEWACTLTLVTAQSLP